jgi:uncharacterized protein (TIRG00374 family)
MGEVVKRRARLIIASFAFVALLVWLLRSGSLPLLPPEGTLASLKLPAFLAFVALMLVHMVVRYARCWLLIAPITPVPMSRIMIINGIAGALITFLPFRVGEMARPAMLREKGKLSIMNVTGTVAAERILDGVVFSALLLLGLALADPRLPLAEHVGGLPISASLVPRAARLASTGFACAFVVMVVFYRWRAFARRITDAALGIVSKRFAERIASMIERLSDGLRFLATPRHSIPYIVITILSVAAHVWAIDLLADAVGIPELTFAQSAVVVGVLALGFAMPNAPGFFGAVQLAMYAGLAVYLDPAKVVHEGAAMVFLFYVTYLGIIVLLAAFGLAADYAQPARVADAESSSSL